MSDLEPGAAFRRFEAFMRKLVRVPKAEVDQKMAEWKKRKKAPPERPTRRTA